MAYADVPATNLFGVRAEQIVNVLRQPERVRRIMTIENLALWVLVSPLCFLIAMGLLPSQHQPLMSLAIAVAVLCLPFSYLGLAAIVAPLLPFHPMPWRERLRRRDTWLRYGLATGIAYLGITWPASMLAFAPTVAIVRYVGRHRVTTLPLPSSQRRGVCSSGGWDYTSVPGSRDGERPTWPRSWPIPAGVTNAPPMRNRRGRAVIFAGGSPGLQDQGPQPARCQ